MQYNVSAWLLESVSSLKGEHEQLGSTLKSLKPFLAKLLKRYSKSTNRDADDLFQQMLIVLLDYSIEYNIPICTYQGNSYQVIMDDGEVSVIQSKQLKETLTVLKKDIEIKDKLAYNNFIKWKVKQILSDIKKAMQSQKAGHSIKSSKGLVYDVEELYLDAEYGDSGGLLYDIVEDQKVDNPEELLTFQAYKKDLNSKLSSKAYRFMESVEFEASLCENQLSSRLHMTRKSIQISKRELRLLIKPPLFQKFPVHLDAGILC
jgi:hypothetical protein